MPLVDTGRLDVIERLRVGETPLSMDSGEPALKSKH
jgi:hypothetical protein